MVARRRAPRALEAFALVSAALLLVLAVPAGATAAVRSSASASSMIRVQRLAPSAVPSGSAPAGSTPAAQPLSLQVALPPAHAAQLSALIAGLYDPSSPQYHHWLSPSQFDARFAPSPEAVGRVDAWLTGLGIQVTRRSAFALERVGTGGDGRVRAGRVSAPVHVARTALLRRRPGTVASERRVRRRRGPARPRHRPPASVVALPGAPAVRPDAAGTPAVSPHADPHADGLTACSAATSAATQSGSLTPDQVGAQYHVGTVTAAGENGSGATVAVYELAPHLTADVNTYETCFGLHNIVTKVTVDTGGSADPGGTDEADADIEEVATQAPGATVLSYEGPNTAQGAYDTWSAIVGQNSASAISTSWGECEPAAASDGELTADDALFREAAAQGQTIVAASGDSGSEDCFAETNGTDTSLEVDFPASDPSVTGVGGTTFASGGQESAWNDCEGQTGPSCALLGDTGSGGGGISQYAVRPTWQPADWEWGSASFACGTNCRDVPDLAANAGTPEVFYANGSWGAFVGTSISAPVIAAIVGDVGGGCAATRKGILAPLLYGLVSQQEYGQALTDVTAGDNDLTRTYTGTRFPASPAYDAVTGVGTPLAPGWSCPEVSSVSPSSGNPGDDVTLIGLGLQKATIAFGSAPAQVVSASASSAVVVVPAGGGTVSVRGTSSWGSGKVSASFTFDAPAPPPAASGYDLVGSDGGVFVFPTGQASGFFGSLPGIGVHVHDIVGMVPSPDDGGYFLVGSDGGVFAFGDAPFEGSLPGIGVHVADIRAIVPTADNRGYFLVGSDGGVFAFGDARYLGSLPGLGIHVDDVVGIAATPDDAGYWVVDGDGAVHGFGDAPALGSDAGTTSPVSGISATADGGGYWIVTRNGGVSAFGDAVFHGSLPFISQTPAHPVVSLVPTADDGGYWLIGSDGGIFAFGAPFVGSLPGLGIAVTDIVGAVPA